MARLPTSHTTNLTQTTSAPGVILLITGGSVTGSGVPKAEQGKWESQGLLIADKALTALRRVFDQWISMIPQYARRSALALHKPDYFFWYNERTSVGSIAAAAWLAGGFALEEYSAPKRGYRGRADLWILIHGEMFAIEAKQQWPSIGTRAMARTSLSQVFLKWLDDAARGARKLREGEGRKVGLVYIVPSLPESDANEVESCVRDFLNEAKKLRVPMIWWFEPKLQPRPDEDDRRLYPGVLILLTRA